MAAALAEIAAGNDGAGAGLILGIDLGTTFSLAAYATPNGPVMVRDGQGEARVPSVLGFRGDQVIVGQQARHHTLSDPEHTIFSVKRLIGKTMTELREELSYVPYQVRERETADGRRLLHVVIDGREHTPEELSARILTAVVDRAEAVLGFRPRRAIITVPAYFDETQRQATRHAGRLAGLEVVRIINEPTAAALAYGLQAEKTDASKTIAVYDFGGGTFDCSILRLSAGVFKVLATNGDTHLGGDDVDRAVMDQLAADATTLFGSLDGQVREALRDAAEQAKIALTESEATLVTVEIADRPGRLTRTVTRAELESWAKPLVDRTLACCRNALRDAELTPADIDEVVLVGGSSRMPLVRQAVARMFGRPPHCELNPDEVVALGAAVQANILAGQSRDILLLDVTPLSLGIEALGGTMQRMIGRNSTIPARAVDRFTTAVDGQTGVDIHVLQGEREMAADCRSLGRFRLSNIPPMAAGLPQIDVTFLIDADGMLQVSAKEQRSGQEQSIAVRPSLGLTRDEVDTMVLDSVRHAQEDFAARQLAELRVKAETNLRATEKSLTQAGADLSDAERGRLLAALDSVRSQKESAATPALRAALDELDAAAQPLVERVMSSLARSVTVGKRLSEVTDSKG